MSLKQVTKDILDASKTYANALVNDFIDTVNYAAYQASKYYTSSYTKEAQKVEITYSGLSSKITNAITYLDFVQNNKVDENNKECRYLLHFEDENGERISNECVIIANYENTDVKDRFFREKFVFKNISYDKEKNYYLVITDEETGIESSRVRFTIDIAITNNFEF